ncbi:MAG: hypothetical protein UEY91_08020 [Lachnospiraceae bacterium]|nr:hypothetical protein [Lachnospiraceae bacterium]
MKEKLIKENYNIRQFIMMLAFVDLATFITNYRGWVRSYNTTMLALSYEYGFTSRSLLGTIYHILDAVIPVDMMQYQNAIVFANVITVLFIVFLLYFSYHVLKKSDKAQEVVTKAQQYILLTFHIAMVATFTYAYNFLRVDFCMVWMMLLGFMSLMNEKTEWLSLLFAALGIMFHQGFVLMYFNVILVIQFYYMMTRKNKKNTILFFLTFLIGSGMFLWFELFSRTNGNDIFETVLQDATNVSYQGIYHTTLLYHEVLGIDVSGAETDFVYMNHVQLVLYLLILLPAIVVLARAFVRIIKKADDLFAKLKYLAVAVGSLTILPDMLLKVDYGRWILAVVTYYLLIILAMLVLRDPLVTEETEVVVDGIKQHPAWLIYFTLVVLTVPYMDVDIDMLVRWLQRFMQSKAILFY